MNRFAFVMAAAGVALMQAGAAGAAERGSYEGLAAMHAAANGVPASLVHRVIMRESRYNARAVSRGNYGIMQIRLGTARSMGYTGSAAGLLDPNTNMTYAVKYLAGAYRAAGGNESRAVALYASGYYSHVQRASYTPRASRSRQTATTSYGMFSAAPEVRQPRRARRVATTWQNPLAALFAPSRSRKAFRVARNYR
jgi:soluble lytic murein transglycosylase-like protein